LKALIKRIILIGENVTLKYGEMGPGKSMYMFSAERLPLFTPCQASVGRASRRGEQKAESGKHSAENVYVDLP
jgi:hypothetical protein